MIKFVEANDASVIGALKVGAFRGAIKDMSGASYHSLKKYYSSTDLKFMYGSSPQHFKAKYFDKTSEPDGPTPAMILGSLVHCLVLTPNEFDKEFVVEPGFNKRTNEGKAGYQEFLAKHEGKLIITDEMLAKANGMRSSVQANKKAMELLEPGLKEMAFFWECPFSNLGMRAKLDQASSKHFVELKTTTSAGPEAFAKRCNDLHYDLSLFHYQTALKQTLDLDDVPAYFLVVENEPPYVTQVYRAGGSCWQTGHAKWLDAVTKLEDGIKMGNWPGYFPAEMDFPELEMPPWAVNKLMKGDQDGV